MTRSFPAIRLLMAAQLGLVLFIGACTEQADEPVTEALPETPAPAPEDAMIPAQGSALTVEKGMYFKPELTDFALHNEYDDDGDGDGINETHVRRYINKAGDTAFSMTSNDKVWAWSLDTKGDDDSDTRKNHVIRDSNCDGVFDERYGLAAEFHVPTCVMEDNSTEAARETQSL